MAPGAFWGAALSEAQRRFRDRFCPQALGESLAGAPEDAVVVGTGRLCERLFLTRSATSPAP